MGGFYYAERGKLTGGGRDLHGREQRPEGATEKQKWSEGKVPKSSRIQSKLVVRS